MFIVELTVTLCLSKLVVNLQKKLYNEKVSCALVLVRMFLEKLLF
jgi:hypothetical protein